MTTTASTAKAGSQAPGAAPGPTNAVLKTKFSAGSIPLDTDFSDLIDVADFGRKAVGQSPDQTDNSTGNGLELNSDGKLTIKAADASLTVTGDGISVNQGFLFPKGTILLYHDDGTKAAPAGWAICDGSQGTPDLTGRFILGGHYAGSQSNAKVTQLGNGSMGFTASSDAAMAEVALDEDGDYSTDGHKLVVDEMASHEHKIHDQGSHELGQSSGTCEWNGDGGVPAVFKNDGNVHDVWSIVYETAGGDQPHAHKITQTAHDHSIDIVTPYYTLMYIMKL